MFTGRFRIYPYLVPMNALAVIQSRCIKWWIHFSVEGLFWGQMTSRRREEYWNNKTIFSRNCFQGMEMTLFAI